MDCVIHGVGKESNTIEQLSLSLYIINSDLFFFSCLMLSTISLFLSISKHTLGMRREEIKVFHVFFIFSN